MADYKYLIVNVATGEPLAEVPLLGVTFSYVLNGCGQLTASFPADAYFATEELFQDQMRELTVLRTDTSGLEIPVWNGPIVNLRGSRRGGWELTAREAIWWLQKRTIEELLEYTDEDLRTIFADLVDGATSKTANGDDGMTVGADINAAILNFSVASGLLGVTKSYSFAADQGYFVFDAIRDVLVGDPDTGLDFRMNYGTGSTRQTCQRKIELGSPSLGVQLDTMLRANDLDDYGRTMDWEQAATRETVPGNNGYVARRQNSTAVGEGEPLTEAVDDGRHLQTNDAVDAFAKDMRHARRPPVHDRWVQWVPGKTLPWGWCELGDQVRLDIAGPGMLQLTAQRRRLIQLDVTPPARGGKELVRGTLSITTDEVTD